MQYKEIITINDRTSLEEATEWGARCGEQFRMDFALLNFKVIFEFLHDAGFTYEMIPFATAYSKKDYFADVIADHKLMAWCRHSLPIYVFIDSMIRTLISDVVYFEKKAASTEEIRRAFKGSTVRGAKTVSDYEHHFFAGFLYTMQPICAYYSNDPEAFHLIHYKSLKNIEKTIDKKIGINSFILRFAGFLANYIEFVQKKIIPALEQVEIEEAAKIKKARSLQFERIPNKVYSDEGFKNNAFNILNA